MERKVPKGSFPSEGKEPIIERIFWLVDRYPSKSEAARAWGVNESTLKNYYKRRHLNPTPRLAQLVKIADCENISLKWLTTGEGKKPEKILYSLRGIIKTTSDNEKTDSMRSHWLEIYDTLNEEERERLLYQVRREGINSLFKNQGTTAPASQEIPLTAIKTAELILSLSEEQQREIFQDIEDKKQASLSNSLDTKKRA